jgi:uncharacterized membrane protein YobD (UPF0266 family)
MVILACFFIDYIGAKHFGGAMGSFLLFILLSFCVYYLIIKIFRSKHIFMNSDGFHFNNKTIPWGNISKIVFHWNCFTIVYSEMNEIKKTEGLWGFWHTARRTRELIQLYASKNHTYVAKGIFNIF